MENDRLAEMRRANWSKAQICPAKGMKSMGCGKICHFAGVCCSVTPEGTPNQTTYLFHLTAKTEMAFMSKRLIVNGRPMKFTIVDGGLPVTLIPRFQ